MDDAQFKNKKKTMPRNLPLRATSFFLFFFFFFVSDYVGVDAGGCVDLVLGVHDPLKTLNISGREGEDEGAGLASRPSSRGGERTRRESQAGLSVCPQTSAESPRPAASACWGWAGLRGQNGRI